MSRQNQIIVALVVLGGLSGLAYWQFKKDAEIGKASDAKVDLPEIKIDDVDKVSVKNGDHPEVILEKKGDVWAMSKPIAANANQQSVKSLLDNMKELKVKDLISTNVSEDEKKDYGLDPSHAIHIMAWKANDKKGDLSFGKSGARGEVVEIEGKPGVYAASGYSSYLYARDVKTWRDMEIFKFDDANANQVTIDNTNGAFSFTKGDSSWGATYKGQPLPKFDESKLKDFLRVYKNLSADDFGDGKTDADTGLDAPASTITISLKDNAGKYVVKVGKTQVGTNRYAMKDGDSTIFVIPPASADWAVADLSKFQQTPDSGAPKDAGGPPHLSMPHGMPGMPGGMPGGMPPGHP